MARTAEDLVRTEVHYCVSSLVSVIASGYGVDPLARTPGANQLVALTEQAFELALPIDDWESAAEEAGFSVPGQDPDKVDAYRRVCEENDIEPYAREAFEHWIVSDWLADKLAEKGEKVDKDFAGMTVWARTTTGQGVASDSVIEQIAKVLNNG